MQSFVGSSQSDDPGLGTLVGGMRRSGVAQRKLLWPDGDVTVGLVPTGRFVVAHSHDSVGKLCLEKTGDLGLASKLGI